MRGEYFQSSRTEKTKETGATSKEFHVGNPEENAKLKISTLKDGMSYRLSIMDDICLLRKTSKIVVGIAADQVVLPTNIGWAVCGGAIGEALDRLRNLRLIEDYDFRFYVNYSECDPAAAVGVGYYFMKQMKVDMVLGPPCPKAAKMMAHLSTKYEVPWIGWGFVTAADFALGAKYPFATTIIATSQTFGYSVARFLKEFDWNNLSIVYTSNEVKYCDGLVADVEAALNDQILYNPDIVYKQQINRQDIDPLGYALNEIRRRSRIVLVCLDTGKDRRDFLIRTSQLGMSTDEFVYVFMSMRGYAFGQSGTGKEIKENDTYEQNPLRCKQLTNTTTTNKK
ncbi:hypothetical protein NECAME_07629 [Necator americanus]|uniref:Receptor ligand binding region domain-containing protein n=1 Tax=Necator americanus TaxID=51031 RepID=W2TLJ6_NECAM|nr:hypothetical protein NECAME_07629 [Necator americanus]ETN82975.1 hypothetical protein NECAME_07629 [Necator americanus]